jgi:hypothetical protein
MNSQEFVVALKVVACENASKGVMEALRNPPGRKPDPALSSISRWFNSLLPDDRNMVKNTVELATQQAVYNVLLVIDGLLAVSPPGQGVRLELLAKAGRDCKVLNDPAKELLSHFFKEK